MMTFQQDIYFMGVIDFIVNCGLDHTLRSYVISMHMFMHSKIVRAHGILELIIGSIQSVMFVTEDGQ